MKRDKGTDASVDIKADDYVTVSVSRCVIPGQQKHYENWLAGISSVCATFPGYLGTNFLRPSGGDSRYTTIYRFDNQEHADDWRNSLEHKEWIARLEGITKGESNVRSVTGFGSWFDLPTIAAEKRPVRWRMCIVLMVVVFSLITVLGLILSPLLANTNQHLRTAIVVCLQVILMTYWVMPRVTSYLKNWLYK